MPLGEHPGAEGTPTSVLTRLWAWLTRCATPDCDERPTQRGWCDLHAPADNPPPDEYWGDRYRGDEHRDDDPTLAR